MQLFDDSERAYMGSKEARESYYEFLNRSAQPEFVSARERLEHWFLKYPEQHRYDLGQSFRSHTDATHLGAFFELYCHELFTKQGLGVQVQQIVDASINKPIDFVVSHSDDNQFYVEATLASDSEASMVSRKLLWQLQDALNKLVEPYFQIGLEVEQEATNSLPISQICSDIHKWLQTFDPDEVTKKGRDDRPYCYWDQDGWKITFLAFARPIEVREKSGDTVLYQISMPKKIPSPNALSNALKEKSKKYGDMRFPYVIAVDMIASYSFGMDVKKVLFGQEVALINPHANQVQITRSPFLPDRPYKENGFWIARRRPRNQQVSAVLLVEGAMPWSDTYNKSVLWHNPYATRPLNPGLWQGPQMILDKETSCMRLYEASEPNNS